jgi:hypothetical protein
MKSRMILMSATSDIQPLTTAVLYEVAAAKYIKML